MSAKHDWAVRALDNYLTIDEYDLDTTRTRAFGKLHTCQQCALRVIADAGRTPCDEPGVPLCRPPTYQTAEQLQAERLFLAAEAMCGPPDHLPAEPVPEPARIAAGQVAVALAEFMPAWLTRNVHAQVSIGWWNDHKKERLLLLRLVEVYLAHFERRADWNWDHYDDDHDWDGEDRFHPDEMQARLRELQARISESILAAEVIES